MSTECREANPIKERSQLARELVDRWEGGIKSSYTNCSGSASNSRLCSEEQK
jgi:hypothetical protein